MIDIASDLKQRFDYAAYFFLSAWERDPNGLINEQIVYDYTDAETQLIDTFENLRDSVHAIPVAVLANVQSMRAMVGPEKYEELLGDAIQSIGAANFPKDATEFLETLSASRSLQSGMPSGTNDEQGEAERVINRQLSEG